jgi:hypothetical protein
MFTINAISEVGGHRDNEDAYLFQPHPESPDCLLCCVADGQGGRAGGARAAQVACQTVIQTACQTPLAKITSSKGWSTALQLADRAVAADPEAGFTTLIGFSLNRGFLLGASSGDSALLLVNQTGSTILTERQTKNPPVGSGEASFREFVAELGKSWRVLAMTDGVWKYAGWERIIESIQLPVNQSVLADLRQSASLRNTGTLQDDFTAILIGEI